MAGRPGSVSHGEARGPGVRSSDAALFPGCLPKVWVFQSVGKEPGRRSEEQMVVAILK